MHATVDIPDYWTSEQALAVFELLDELREQVWERYQEPIVAQFRADIENNDNDDQLELPLFPFNDDIPF